MAGCKTGRGRSQSGIPGGRPAAEKAEAQKKAEEDAITARKNQEIQTRKNTFLSALRDVENLEYQSEDAEDLVQNAISKLSLVETYEEAASYAGFWGIRIPGRRNW